MNFNQPRLSLHAGKRLALIVLTLSLAPSAFAAKVLDIDVIGNRNVARDTILSEVQSLKKGREFASEDAVADRDRIDSLGLFKDVQYEPRETADGIIVVFKVVENPIVNSITLEGNVHVPTSELQKGLETKVGNIVNFNSLQHDTEKILSTYRDKGYLADIVDRKFEGGDVVFAVLEYKVHEIVIKREGSRKKTRDQTIRRELRIKKGDLYDLNKVRRDIARLRDTEIFEDIRFSPDVPENAPPGTADIVLTMKETSTSQLLLGIATTGRSEFVGYMSLNEKNFRGKGELLALRTEVGDRRTYELIYNNPWFDEKHTAFSFSGGDREFFRDPRGILGTALSVNANTNFLERRKGGNIGFSRPKDDRQDTFYRVGFRYDDVSFIQRSALLPGQIINTSFGVVSAPSLGLSRDTRDSRLDSNTGFFGLLGFEIATAWLGSDFSFQKLDFDIRKYLPLGKNKVDEDNYRDLVAGRLVAGRIFGGPPVFEQYFIGGAESIRGYDIDRMYGENQLIANVELRHRLQKNFTGVLFLDYGSSWGGANSNTPKFKGLVGKGFGMRLRTPFGPLRLDLGFGDRTRFHFSVGQAF